MSPVYSIRVVSQTYSIRVRVVSQAYCYRVVSQAYSIRIRVVSQVYFLHVKSWVRLTFNVLDS